jgi:UDP-GlcNAc:undecaprenyl-phosphate GlcNAc-1-phosphate transferase
MLTGMLALVITAFLVEGARRVAPVIGLVDRPGSRKSHKGNIPLVGGIAIFSGILMVMTISGYASEYWAFFAAAAVLVAVGVWDDAAGLDPVVRLLVQSLAVLIVAIGENAYVADLGTIIPVVGNLKLGWLSLPFTVIAGVGIINAFNMSDGVDGHCGTLTLVALAGLGIVAASAGKQSELMLIITLSGGLVGFLFYNVRVPGRDQAKVFLGDAGSYLLGLAVLYFTVRLSQGPNRAMPPVAALWFCMVPLIDTIGMIIRRIRLGRSPFAPDREHIHHIFLHAKFSVTATWIGLAVVAIAGMLIGLLGTLSGASEPFMFSSFLVVGGLYYLMMKRAWQALRFLKRSINRRSPAMVDRRVGGERRQRDTIYYVDGIPKERRSGGNRRQRDRRDITVKPEQRPVGERPTSEEPDNRAARTH